jgi:hypothetical protein
LEHQFRSSNALDFIRAKLGGSFVTPNNTRWNSFFDAMARTKYFMIDIPEEFQDLPIPRREWLAGFCVRDKI